MAFFRKWRHNNKHKKLSEEWALATSLKDLSSEIFKIDGITGEDDDEESTAVTSFNLKYLGCTPINAERSENATALAIKSVITNGKNVKRKNKHVILNISPSGIEMYERKKSNNKSDSKKRSRSTSSSSTTSSSSSDSCTASTSENNTNYNENDVILNVSIYKISYCSIDASHDRVFAFVGTGKGSAVVEGGSQEDELSCFVYLCPKRKIAEEVTLTVARCFENAYQNWKNQTEKKMYQDEMKNNNTPKRNNIIATDKNSEGKQNENINREGNESSSNELLIDFTQNDELQNRSDGDYNTMVKSYLQNTWISFEDENDLKLANENLNTNATWSGTTQLVF